MVAAGRRRRVCRGHHGRAAGRGTRRAVGAARHAVRPVHRRPARSPPPGPQQSPAAQSADAARRARAAWETHGRPTALVIVRPTSVDLVDQGRLTRRIPRTGGTLTLAGAGPVPPAGLAVDHRRHRQALGRRRPHAGRHPRRGRSGDDAAAGRRGDGTGGRVALHRRWRSDAARGHRDVGGPHLRPGDGARSGPSVRPRVAGRPVHGHRRHARATSAPRRATVGSRPTSRTTRASTSTPAAPGRWCGRRCCATAPGSSSTAPRVCTSRVSPSAARRAPGWSCAAIAARR